MSFWKAFTVSLRDPVSLHDARLKGIGTVERKGSGLLDDYSCDANSCDSTHVTLLTAIAWRRHGTLPDALHPFLGYCKCRGEPEFS